MVATKEEEWEERKGYGYLTKGYIEDGYKYGSIEGERGELR